ncbi:MAG: HipA domain-containing protein [Gammaproteobacteria bacterium]|nr:HipA domain-containing protein [Gammaproteobacteria bacterium]
MSRDRQAVVWTRLAARPVKMGDLYITDRDCRFSYDLDYLHTGLPGLGLIYAPEIVQENTIVRPRSEFFEFLPPIQALIPPKGDKNFQRQLILNYLNKKGLQASGANVDWEILKVAGHGGIGHLDVFENDERALEWYGTPAKNELFEVTDELGFSLKEFLTWFDHDAEGLINIIGPTPSVGGAIPKLLLSIADTGWDNRIGLPTRIGSRGITDVVVKFEQSVAYPGINDLEALTLDVHREAGFDVPRYWQAEINGIPVMAIERFDRDKHHLPVFTESLYSVLASGDGAITHNYSYSYDAIGHAIDVSPIDLVSDRQAGKLYLFRRLILALLTGNGDLHMENLSLLQREGISQFTPVYDPTPMRAYSIHNMLTVMPFGDYGELVTGHEKPVGLLEALKRFAANMKISRAQMSEIICEQLVLTESYADRLTVLERLPRQNRDNLISIVVKLRDQIKALCLD